MVRRPPLNAARFKTRLLSPATSGESAPLYMKEKSASASKAKRNEAVLLLELLKKVLPKAAPDPILAEKIYFAVEEELRAKNRVNSFEKFCERVELPDLETPTLDNVLQQFTAAFGEGEVVIKPDAEEKKIAVEVSLPDGSHLTSQIPVRAVGPETDGEQEVKLTFVPFPVALPGDPELIWALAKRENMSSDEAGIALAKAEEEFWASKTGQKLQRDRVEKTFPEFIARVPAGMLGDLGLKRHYKLPEPLKILKAIVAQKV